MSLLTKSVATKSVLIVALSVAVAACVAQKKDSAAPVAKTADSIPCGGHRTGWSSLPTPATIAANEAYVAATTLSTGELIARTAKGDMGAQIELGLRYVKGDRIEKDAERAVALFQAAADQENPLGQYFLGTAYAQGVGLPKDEYKAIELWELASKQGYSFAQYWLGAMIANGFGGISKSVCAAIPLYEAAAESGNTDAAFSLGLIYQNGDVGEPNYEEAAKWYRMANKTVKDMRSQVNLRMLIEDRKVQWRQGDPGKPPADAAGEKKLKIVDPTGASTG
ncbi:MAG: sel1 repeat family protein [Rhodospirillaceae bacterium]|nr:sel1 repeat family protein [Rhodospirillaceae bacterium]